MSYLSLYRKWRPLEFDDIVGQNSVTKTLQNAIKLDRIAHAYLFCGPRGTGKTSTAKVFAKSLNCSQGPTINPCHECEACQKIEDNNSIDVIEIDAASNRGIDEIRKLREKVKFFPTEGNYKIYIIDEAHMLTKEAFNALLKTLEEPPEYVIFILATTEPHSLLPTILSRCQRFDFSRLSIQNLEERLNFIAQQEEIELSTEAALSIAKNAEGGMRDAISLLDQVISYSGAEITNEDVAAVLGLVEQEALSEVVTAIINQDIDQGLQLVNQIINQGKDIQQFVNALINHFRNLLINKQCQSAEKLIELPADRLAELQEQAKQLTTSQLLRLINILVKLENDLKESSYAQVLLEMGIIKLIKSEHDTSKEKDLVPADQIIEQSSKSEEKSETRNVKSEVQVSNQSKVETNSDESKQIKDNKSANQTDTSNEAISTSNNLNEQLTFNELKNRWQEILNYLRKNEAPTYAVLVEGRLADLENNNIIVEFAEKNRFHKESVERKAGVITEVIEEVLGVKLQLNTVFAGSNNYSNSNHSNSSNKSDNQEVSEQSIKQGAPQQSKDEQKDQPSDISDIKDNPLVKKVLETFNGEIVKVEEN
ncbi:MAG: DNA polymerase III subunit gamma/tau [Bacillota bacterium]